MLFIHQNKDFYKILNLKYDCSPDDILISYKNLSRLYHPDRNKNNQEIYDIYSDINYAYSVLKDPLKRRVFDLYGADGVKAYESPKNQIHYLKTSGDFNIGREISRVGNTLRVYFPVDLYDIYFGRKFQVVVSRTALCRCPHKGFMCDKCKGRSTIKEEISIPIYLEKGMEENSVITFRNIGDSSESSGPGDVEVVIISKKHEVFSRKGSDLHASLNITFKESLLGFTRAIRGLNGTIINIVSKGTFGYGKKIILKNNGLPKYFDKDVLGDLIISPEIVLPSKLTDNRKKMISRILENR